MANSIAIIGGGIAGASVAYHLSTRIEAPITVYERDAIGAATTARSTAVFRMMDDPLLVSMKRYGMKLYNELLASSRANPTFELVGRLEVATEGEGAAQLQEKELQTGAYFSGEQLSETVFCPELDTDAVTGALYNPNAGYFLPVELVHEFAERARSNGVEFRSNTEVIDIETAAHGVSAVRTTAERVPASRVVCATGPWNLEVGRLAGLELPIRHTLAPIVKLEPTTPLKHTLLNVKHRESGYYFLGQDDGSVLVGHSPGSYAEAGTEYDPNSVPDSVPDEIVSGMTDVLSELLPSLLDATIVDEWVGVRSLTPDGYPLVGPTAVDGFSVVGFNSEGIQLAPAAGTVIAAQLTGEKEPPYAAAVSPVRFGDETV